MSLIECKELWIIKIMLSFHKFLGNANKALRENDIIKVRLRMEWKNLFGENIFCGGQEYVDSDAVHDVSVQNGIITGVLQD